MAGELRSGETGYDRFVALLDARGASVSSLALLLNGRNDSGAIIGRTSLAEVLLGKRAGESVWRRLVTVLTEEEYRTVKQFADSRLAASGGSVSPIVLMKKTIADVRGLVGDCSDDAELVRRIREMFSGKDV